MSGTTHLPRRGPGALLLAALFALPAATGCVKRSTHDATLAELADSRAGREALEDTLEEERAEARARQREWESTEAELRDSIGVLEEEMRRLERRRSDAESRFEQARDEVYRLETLLNERGSEYRRLEQQLQALRAIEREVRERNRIYEDVIGRFRSLIDAGKLSVSIEGGRLVIQLPQDVLFPSGSATLSADGRRTISEVGTVLAEIDDRTFQVEGHTDDVPISTARFPSNWELSTARALSVVHLLVEQGVPAGNLSGAGYGEHQPVASNDDAQGRRRNRRIEIVMLPNLNVIADSELPG